MRVLHVIPSLDKKDGGPSVALPLMLRSLAMQGVEADVATTMTRSDAKKFGLEFYRFVNFAGCRVLIFPRQTNFYKFSLPLAIWLFRHVIDYQIVHNHALFSFAPLLGSLAAIYHHIPYVIRPLGLLNEWGMQNRRRTIKLLSFKWIERPILNCAAAIHYTSTRELEEAARLNLNSRAIIIPLGLDVAAFQDLPDPGLFLSKHPELIDKKILLFMSRIDLKKGLELLLEALTTLHKKHPDIMLVIAGTGDQQYIHRLKNQAEALGVCQYIHWVGFLDENEKKEAFAASDIFLLPSHSENFGIALLEAMAAGLPCIASDQVALAVEPQVQSALIAVPCKSNEIQKACEELISDAQRRIALSKKAIETVKDKFSLESMGVSMAKEYDKIASMG